MSLVVFALYGEVNRCSFGKILMRVRYMMRDKINVVSKQIVKKNRDLKTDQSQKIQYMCLNFDMNGRKNVWFMAWLM